MIKRGALELRLSFIEIDDSLTVVVVVGIDDGGGGGGGGGGVGVSPPIGVVVGGVVVVVIGGGGDGDVLVREEVGEVGGSVISETCPSLGTELLSIETITVSSSLSTSTRRTTV